MAIATVGVGMSASVARGELPAEVRKELVDSSLIYTATQRKDGSRSSVAPIWFWYDGESDYLYTTTSPTSWKAKRIAGGSPLYIWVGEKDGPFLVGDAERIDDLETIAMMGEKYSDKYFIAWLGFFRPRPERVSSGKTVAYRVDLKPGEPEG